MQTVSPSIHTVSQSRLVKLLEEYLRDILISQQDGTFKYVRLTFTTNQGRKYMTNEEARQKAGEDPDFQCRSIFETLESGKTISWDVHAQIINPDSLARYSINIFDSTKSLPEEEFPLRRFGRVVLTHTVDSIFCETEQSAFSPTNLVPGWALSPDPSEPG